MSYNKTLPEALKSFDSLPNTSFVRLPVVRELFGVSTATIWRLVAAGVLRTHKLTPRTTTFNVGELRDVLFSKTKPIRKSKGSYDSNQDFRNKTQPSSVSNMGEGNHVKN